jgi:SAM-dependent methyltransferase
MSVQEQYEDFPYPERNPSDERKRLITGSPSHPLEIDHMLFGGKRDWSKGTRILVAGGGTGDALVQIAQVLTAAKKPYEITYVDLSKASRKIAEERINIRRLKNVRFVTGSLLDAASYGQFDYIDCCGVLHHLPEPQAGFDALAGALAPDGGIGLMVYAPFGRSGVYPLQEAFGALTKGMSGQQRLATAKAMFKALPEGHPFKRNPHLVDHNESDAGFYDLLLHSQDQPFTIDALNAMLNRAELQLRSVPQPALYDLSRFTGDCPEDLGAVQKMALAEKLDGTIKTHIVYASPKSSPDVGFGMHSVPHLKGIDPAALSGKVAKTGRFEVTLNGTKHAVSVPKESSKIIAGLNGRRDLETLRIGVGLDLVAWKAIWGPLETQLLSFGLLLYSRLLR